METTKLKIPIWKKILYAFLLFLFLAIGASVWTWGISVILSFIISVISIAMIHFFWEELGGKKENSEAKKQEDTIK
jgi:hypothetical protein